MTDLAKAFQAAAGTAIYLDADHDIAGVIELVKQQPGPMVVLVLPKRSDVFKNSVNLKLLKSVLDHIDKQVVLVTNDQLTSGLAQRLGFPVSPSLKQDPVSPRLNPADEQIWSGRTDPIKIVVPASVRTGKDSGSRPAAGSRSGSGQPPRRKSARTRAAKAPRSKPPARLNRLSDWPAWLRLFALAGLPLIALGVAVAFWWPETQLTVQITSQPQRLALEIEAQLSQQPGLAEIEPGSISRLPLTVQSEQVDLEVSIVPTGKRNIGDYASGQITVTNCGSQRLRLPSGTTFKNNQNRSYLSLATIEMGPGTGAANCPALANNSKTVRVRAATYGRAYNNPAQVAYSIVGQPDSGHRSWGEPMTGGSSQEISIIKTSDIDQAKSRLRASRADDQVQNQLQLQAQANGYLVFAETAKIVAEPIKDTVDSGSRADQVGSVSQKITYYYLSLARPDLEALVIAQISHQIQDQSLVVLETGLETASYQLTNQLADLTDYQADFSLKISISQARIGHQLQPDQIFAAIAGRDIDQAAADLRSLPGIETVDIKVTPFWVGQVPEDQQQVTIIINPETVDPGPV